MSGPRNVLIVFAGGYLCRYWAGWMEYGDDPTTWTSKRASALRMTAERAAKLLPAVRAWHDDATVQS